MNPDKTWTYTIVIAEDDEDDFFLLRRNLNLHFPEAVIHRVYHGEELLNYLQTQEKPSLIILDLNMPCTDGREVLRAMKKDDALKNISVIVLTTSNSETDKNFALEQGAAFFTKPYGIANYSALMRSFKEHINPFYREVAT